MVDKRLMAHLALASLLSLAVADILLVFLVAVDVLSGHESLAVATPKMIYFALLAGVSSFALPLVWWGHRIGYYVAMAVALVSLLANLSGIGSALRGAVPFDVNVASAIVGLAISAILLVAGAIASRSRPA